MTTLDLETLWAPYTPPAWEPDLQGRTAAVLVRGGGDLASGVVLRLWRAGIPVVVTELPRPLVVRRKVAFAEAIYQGRTRVDGVPAVRVEADPAAVRAAWARGQVPVVVDPDAQLRRALSPAVLVDARMTKRAPELGLDAAPLVIGLGPGFVAGQNCHAVVETMRGHTLGRVLWQGPPLPDTGLPEAVRQHQADRVLRAPADGVLETLVAIGQVVEPGTPLLRVAGREVRAPFRGVIRGLMHPGLPVTRGLKVGDLDPRAEPRYAYLVSDKSLAIGGGVLEAVLAFPALRACFYAHACPQP